MYSKEENLSIELFMIDLNIHLLTRWVKGYLKIDVEISKGVCAVWDKSGLS